MIGTWVELRRQGLVFTLGRQLWLAHSSASYSLFSDMRITWEVFGLKRNSIIRLMKVEFTQLVISWRPSLESSLECFL